MQSCHAERSEASPRPSGSVLEEVLGMLISKCLPTCLIIRFFLTSVLLYATMHAMFSDLKKDKRSNLYGNFFPLFL